VVTKKVSKLCTCMSIPGLYKCQHATKKSLPEADESNEGTSSTSSSDLETDDNENNISDNDEHPEKEFFTDDFYFGDYDLLKTHTVGP